MGRLNNPEGYLVHFLQETLGFAIPEGMNRVCTILSGPLDITACCLTSTRCFMRTQYVFVLPPIINARPSRC